MVPPFILSTFMVLVLFYLRCGDFNIYHVCCKIVDFNFFFLGKRFLCVSPAYKTSKNEQFKTYGSVL